MKSPSHDTPPPRPETIADDVGRLVRLAEPRREMSRDRLTEMREELRPLWRRQVRRRALWHRPLPLAASLAVLALGGLIATRLLLREAPEVATVARVEGAVTAWRGSAGGAAEGLTAGTLLRAGRSVATDRASRVAFQTADGRSVRLDHSTRIVWLAPSEIRLEQGALYVDSGASSEGGPGLEVYTPLGRVEEIGTQFEVRLEARALQVRVREGRVIVGSARERHEGRAGEELILSAGHLSRGRIAADSPVFSWTQEIAPAWRLDGTRLHDFLVWAARESGRRLVFQSPAAAREAQDVTLSGDLEDLAPRDALEVVLPAVGFSARTRGADLIVEMDAPATPRAVPR